MRVRRLVRAPDPHPQLAPLLWLFPLGMAVNVLITGNHYVLDIVGSVVPLITTAVLWGHLAARRG